MHVMVWACGCSRRLARTAMFTSHPLDINTTTKYAFRAFKTKVNNMGLIKATYCNTFKNFIALFHLNFAIFLSARC